MKQELETRRIEFTESIGYCNSNNSAINKIPSNIDITILKNI